DAFHYVVYADRYAESGSSGLSRGVPAADLMVTDGDESWGPDGFSRIQERGTLMHELGHNLSLRLGGPDDTTLQNDPSYESIMNYAYQLGGLPPDQRPDYSVGSPYNDWAHIRFDGGSIGDLGDVAPVTVTFDAAQVPLGQTDLEMVLYSPALGLDVHDAQGSVIGLAIDAAAVQEDLAEATDAAASSTEPPSAEVLTVLENLLVTGSGGQTPPDASTPSKPKTDATGSFGPALVGGAAKAPAGGSSAEGLAGTGNWAANQSTARRLISYRN
ncbi:MAG: hypothetical protein LBG11_07475, partial [Bifidobacteriaceae bacterium]|nr:hypothetical protein [Bifidobacteriaceae bacterium]